MANLEKIINLIEETKKSAYQLEKEIGLKRATIYDWKAGRGFPKSEHLIKLSRYFGVTTDYLLGLAEEKPKYQFFFESLSPDNQMIALGFLEDLLKKQDSDIKKVIAAVKKATRP